MTISSLSRPCVARTGGAQPRARTRRRPRARTCTHAASHSTFSSSAKAAGAAPDSAAKPSSASACDAARVSARAQLGRARTAHLAPARHGQLGRRICGGGLRARAHHALRLRLARRCCTRVSVGSHSAPARHAPLAGARCARRKHAGAVHANAAIAAIWARSERGMAQAQRADWLFSGAASAFELQRLRIAVPGCAGDACACINVSSQTQESAP